MPLLIAITGHGSIGDRIERRGTIEFTGAYPVGGVAFTPKDFGFSTMDVFTVQIGLVPGDVPLWPVVKGTKLMLISSGGEQSGSNLAGVKFPFSARGTV